jgi:hypothetical protein
MGTVEIKKVCSYNKETFVCKIQNGFISKKRSDVIAGMSLRFGNVSYKKGNFIMRKVGTKESYIVNKTHLDGDVQIYGVFTNLEQAKKVNII